MIKSNTEGRAEYQKLAREYFLTVLEIKRLYGSTPEAEYPLIVWLLLHGQRNDLRVAERVLRLTHEEIRRYRDAAANEVAVSSIKIQSAAAAL